MNKIQAFTAKVKSDKALESKLIAAKWDLATSQKIATEAGFQLTSAEMLAAIDELSGDLSDSNLNNVAGGGIDG
jgi:predicted ribosomally synthesized peptide with nif11-like leader